MYESEDRLRTWAQIVYACYALWLVTIGLSGIVGAGIAFLKLNDARGTYVESHFRDQIRVFFWGLILTAIAWFLAITFIGIPLSILLSAAIWVWTLVKVISGWIRLSERRTADI
ncbi:DUF4870 family protein [Roseiterribacter gracilis]|uniref:Membrane protein n=1 Tax=Roseiterribacter gracilis TaxID=2812848 RepID=A0A8S8XDU3_9PROT|nr:membrane protein [Rhodospirillales bacterium TMPK1]